VLIKSKCPVRANVSYVLLQIGTGNLPETHFGGDKFLVGEFFGQPQDALA
jgi:hypothetical protein